MSIQIGFWAKRTGQKWHLVDSVVSGDVVTRCGRRMADKPDAPFQVSSVMPLTRLIGQPQLCKAGCDRESTGGNWVAAHRAVFEDDGSTAPTDDTP